MALSGVGVADDCIKKFEEMKLRHTCKYIIYTIENKKEVVVDCVGEKDAAYEEFKGKLVEDKAKPKFAVVDMSYKTDDGRQQDKIVFFLYSDDDHVPVKDKMLYAGTKDALKKKLNGIHKEHQANQADALEESAILETLAGK